MTRFVKPSPPSAPLPPEAELPNASDVPSPRPGASPDAGGNAKLNRYLEMLDAARDAE